ncbi:hypothetical protein A4X13_0g7014 [Tilletia indica]|uniref:Uncharacterized protein n=1 Tax=Tilletia indica TaxID=43049 RepID=A0A8T8SLE5_9BASI|nr:hypothetical protein A4X13_0g7014 [Tilletia indica]
MADPTILLRMNILSRLDRESERRQLALKTDMSVPLPKLEDLAIPEIYRLDAYDVFRLSKEWHAQHQSMLSSTTAGCGATYDLHRPHSRDIPGLKFFDQVRQEFISVATLDTFRERFEHFTKGILKGLDFYKCVVAGGCVQACLVSFLGSGRNAAYEDSDMDIFIVGATRFQASAKLLHVEAVLRKNVEDFDNVYKIVRTPATVTFTAIHGAHRHHYRQVQVILVLYPDVVDVISHFDLDHTALAYNGEEVFISAGAARAIWSGYSTLTDAIRGSTAPRILKYAHHGFGLLLPNDDDVTIRTIVEREKTHVKNLHEEMTRQNLQDRMGPLLSHSKTGLPHQWTHALTSLSRLEGLWEIACGNTKREKKLFTAAKGHGRMYGFYNE